MPFASCRARWDLSSHTTSHVSGSSNTLISDTEISRKSLPWVDIFHDSKPRRRAWDQANQATVSGQRWDAGVHLVPVPSTDKQGAVINNGASEIQVAHSEAKVRSPDPWPLWPEVTSFLSSLSRYIWDGARVWVSLQLSLGWQETTREVLRGNMGQ